MEANEMLLQLHEHGQDAGSDFNDSDEVDGWFGWEVDGWDGDSPVLTVTYQQDAHDAADRVTVRRMWRLVPIELS